MADSYRKILEFWFGNLEADDRIDEERRKRWFAKSAKFDRLIKDRYGNAVQQAAAGKLDLWIANPHGALGLVILLDQFTRNIFRDTAEAYTHDPKALDFSRRGVASGYLQQLRPIEALFLVMPFMHAEDREAQEQSITNFNAVGARTPEPLREIVDGFVSSAQSHADIVIRFGRFPHRNKMLGRLSTPDEMEFLSQPGSSF